LRLTHPFPSILDGVATAVLALFAGAPPVEAVRLGIAMTALQAAIGAVNDLADAEADAVAKPSKPIPAGLVTRRSAAALAIGALALGLGLSAPSGWGTVAIAAAGLAVGLAYDLWLKGTAWSWLPFAVGIPVLPVYAWYGGTGSVPDEFVILIPAAVAAGAALAIGNARADVEDDLASGISSVATALGPRRAWAAEVVILALVGGVAVVSAAVGGAQVVEIAVLGVVAVVPLAAALLSFDVPPAARERAWEAEAVGVAALAAAWVWAVLASI
jgi:4-hydroxybenzoate polyprenyltransferase